MKKLIIVQVLIILALTANLFGWELNRQTDFPTHLYDLKVIGDNVWVGGKDGALALSTNNGETYQFVENPGFDSASGTYLDINSIDAIDENNIILVGQDGLSFITTDGGESGITIDFLANLFGSDDMEDVIYLPSGKIWAVGKDGKVGYSNDFGMNWQEQISGTTNTIYAISMDETGTGYICGNDGSPDATWINKTTDFGENWQDSGATFNSTPHLYDIYHNAEKVIVSGDDGYFATSNDSGASFTQHIVTGITNDLRNIAMDEDNGYAVGWHGEIIKTTNNWETIEAVENNFVSYFDGIGFNAEGNLVACGWYGNILKSSNEGIYWEEKTVPTYYFYGGSILNESNWYFAGAKSTLMFTDNAGESYNRIEVTNLVEDFYDVHFFDANNAIIATEEDGKIYRTSDAGENWIELIIAMGEIAEIIPLNATSCYIIGDGEIFLTDDMGTNWESISSTYSLISGFVNSEISYFVGENGAVITKDSTGNWNNFAIETSTLTNICFKDENIGVIVNEDGQIYYTNNGGLNSSDWVLANYDGTDMLMGLAVNPDGNFMAVGYANAASNFGVENVILISEDNGVSWIMIDIEQPQFIPTRLNDIMVYENRMVAFGGYELVYTILDISYGTLVGNVTLSGGIGNVEEVVITVGDLILSPDEDGNFEQILEVGTYQLIANLEGYDEVIISDLEITGYEISSVIIELYETIFYGNLNGTITLEGTGEITDVEISIGETLINPDENGFFEVELEVGTYTLSANLAGFDSYLNEEIIINADETTEIFITLTELSDADNELLLTNELFENYPNPFNPSAAGRGSTTIISFSCKENTKSVEIEIFNIKGQRIRQFKINNLDSITNKISWNGKDSSGNFVGSGIYMYRLVVNGKTIANKKMMMLK